ncbi:hypothetical protein ONZ43_g5737 [Nemania bipapillata]|uniref:Uncharacterized protein n=1 Tax=Nemania bipapillata TaxID=110536 RepID=A0ACC2I756_9PEZI|nr:hypothetical protein ONZ43_g5737 [Nemania bipapillata]
MPFLCKLPVQALLADGHTHRPVSVIDGGAPSLPVTPQLNTPTPAPRPIVEEVPILSRGRPIVSGYEDAQQSPPAEPVKINLESPFYNTSPTTTATKPVPAGLRALARLIPEGNDSTLSVASVVSLDKSLPPAPPEASAKDRMTEMMPTDNILASEAVVRKREGEKRKVEALRTQLADVDRKSYELGLKLHRAYKRLDRDAEYEPTTLWVRRVTG